MQHRSVVLAAKLLADFRERSGGELLYEKHGNLTWKCDDLRVAANIQILSAHAKMLANALLNLLDGYFLFRRLDNVLEYLLGGLEIDLDVRQRRIGHEAYQSTQIGRAHV